ncbi:MAG: hypothetical protein OJJ55_19025 [Rhodococcus sp.]|nr:hypothetical protein [Rhodococcus sp. (in: high G+C Gram-positive bacteria)]
MIPVRSYLIRPTSENPDDVEFTFFGSAHEMVTVRLAVDVQYHRETEPNNPEAVPIAVDFLKELASVLGYSVVPV